MPYGYYGFYWMDYTYIFVIIGAVICLIASAGMNSTFSRYQRVRSMSGMTGAMAAERILRDAGIHDVQVQHIQGNLTDHYNPMNKTLSLSDSVYNSTSVAAVGVAAHECGHAIQHAKGYVPLRVRGAFVPIANIGSNLAWPLIIIGLIFRGSMSSVLIQAGIIMFSLAVLFQLITLPVEFNASRRALATIEGEGLLYDDEYDGARKVLRAAALTYVAALLTSLLYLMQYVLMFLSMGRREE